MVGFSLNLDLANKNIVLAVVKVLLGSSYADYSVALSTLQVGMWKPKKFNQEDSIVFFIQFY